MAGWAIPVPSQDPSQDPYLAIFKPQDPTYGQMKAFLLVSMRFPRIGSRIDQELTQNRPRIDPESTLQTSPQMALR